MKNWMIGITAVAIALIIAGSVPDVNYIVAHEPLTKSEASVISEKIKEENYDFHGETDNAEEKTGVETSTSEAKEVPEDLGEEVSEVSVTYYDVPLDQDLQDYIFEVCENYGVDAAIVIAMIEKESNYDADIVGDDGYAFGLMQVQPRWHEARIESLGVGDLLDPYQNVLVGIDYLAELLSKGSEKASGALVWAVMAYNGGPGLANFYDRTGAVSGYYKDVMDICEGLEKAR